MKKISLLLVFISTILHGQVDTLWTNTFGGSDEDYGHAVQQTDDGGYIITGYTRSFGAGSADIYLIKTDSNGDTLWTKTFGDSLIDSGKSVQQTSDGGYIITGYTKSFGSGGSDVWLIKTDSNGDSLWTKTFGGIDGDRGNWVQQTTDGGYILTGFRFPIAYGDADVWLIKTDSNGDSLWTKTFGGDHDERSYGVQQTTDGGYIITGATESYGNGENDIWLIKTDSNGDSLWTKTFGGSSDDTGYSVQQTTDNGYIIAGWTYSYGNGNLDAWLIKTDSNGDSLWTKTFGGNGWDYGVSIQKTFDGGYIFTGATYSYGNGESDVWLIKTDSDGVVEIASTFNLPATYNIHQNYPNPFNPVTTLRYDLPEQANVNIIIYDMLGRQVRTLLNQTQDAGYRSVIWNATNDYGNPVSAGVYLYKIQAGEFVQTKKMVLLK